MSEKQTILVVDDNYISLRHNVMLLQGIDADIVTASSGEEAIAAIDKNIMVDLILLDVNMPGIGGFDLAKMLKSSDKTKSIPIVFITAISGSETKMIEGLGIGALDYIPKPVSKDLLKIKVKNFLDLQKARRDLEFTQFAMENISDSVIWITEEGRISYVNKEACSSLGCKREEISNLSVYDIDCYCLPGKWSACWKELKGKGFLQYESSYRKKNGQVFPVDIKANFISLRGKEYSCCIVRDISERKKVENAFAINEFRFREAFESASIGVALVGLDGKWMKVNKSLCSMLGYSEEELLKKTFQDITFKEDLDADLDNVKKLLSAQIPYYHMEKRYHHKDGSIVWIMLSASLVRDTSNNPLYFVSQVENITERKKSEEKIQSLLREKEMLLKEVHHRIKNNMSTVSSMLLLQANSINDQFAVNVLNDAHTRLQSMSILYDKLYCSENFNEVHLKGYLEKLVDEILLTLSKPSYISVEKNIEELIIPAKISFSIGIIINELLTNIMKYAFTGREKGKITVSAAREYGNIIIVIGDNGVGMPEGVNNKTSNGFGLNLVYMMAKQLKGSVTLESQHGTKFTLEFPL